MELFKHIDDKDEIQRRHKAIARLAKEPYSVHEKCMPELRRTYADLPHSAKQRVKSLLLFEQGKQIGFSKTAR